MVLTLSHGQLHPGRPVGAPARTPASPVPRRTRQPRPGGLSPVRPRAEPATTCSRWPGAYAATLSGAVCAGSNPAGGTAQRHKPEHLGNLGPPGRQPCDLPNADAFSTLPPGRPGSSTPAAESPSSPAHCNDGHRAVAPAAGRCSPQYPQLRSGSPGRADAARGRLPSPPRSPQMPLGRVSLSVISAPHPYAPDPPFCVDQLFGLRSSARTPIRTLWATAGSRSGTVAAWQIWPRLWRR
jgi:hypothetical protein